MHDIVIAAMPFVDTFRPLMAPAVLKSSVEKAGFTCHAIDFNVIAVNRINRHPDREKFLNFFEHQIICDEIVDEMSRLVNYCVDQILSYNSSIVGLSLFSYESQVFSAWVAAGIKMKAPGCRIVIGGPGITRNSSTNRLGFVDFLLSHNYIDDFINGDGEHSLVEYLKGNTEADGINSPVWAQSTKTLSEIPDPDYTDYNFFDYLEPSIPIIDSRGCVQNCEFCDVIGLWKKYQYTTADNTFNQMQRQYQKYGITHFDFRSSISNGNLREFSKLISLISDYNQGKFRSEQFSWEGSFIVRNKMQHKPELWENIKKSNGQLFMGIESVVEKSRLALGKNFTNEDLDYHLEMAKTYQIPVVLLFIAAYHSETLEDYEYVKQWFKDRAHYATNTITKVLLSTLVVIPNSKLAQEAGNVFFKHNNTAIAGPRWVSKKTGITYEQRMQYVSELKELIKECGFAC